MGLLTAADTLLRQGLEKKKLDDTDHIVLAIAPDGAPVICSNCGPAALRAMAAVLVAIADRVEVFRHGRNNGSFIAPDYTVEDLIAAITGASRLAL